MALTQIIDHVAKALGRIVFQFKEKPLIRGTIGAFAGEVQEVEDAFFGILNVFRTVANAVGTVLDDLGRLVGAPLRGLKTDAQYRARINAQILANQSDGSAFYIYGVAKALVANWNVVGQPKILEAGVAQYTIGATPIGSVLNTTEEALELAVLLRTVSGAGIRGIVISQPQSLATSFSFLGGGGVGFTVGIWTSAYD